jgi:phosphate transport system permease protein
MSAGVDLALSQHPVFDATAPLTPSGNLRRRAAFDRLVRLGAVVAAAIGVGMLVIVVYSVVTKGAPALSLSFVFQNPVGLVGGGIANSLLGTAEIVAIGAALALPIGVLTGLYLTEFAGTASRTGRALKLGLDLMQGLPTIVVGLFVYGLIVLPLHKESGFAGAIALAIVMVPLMARSAQEVLLLVPPSIREAADALGVSRWRTVLTVIIPAATGGIATGAILATARAAGETAPLLIVNSIFNTQTTQGNPFGGIPSIPMYIYTVSEQAVPDAFVRAWGAAFVLLLMILLANVLARVLLARSRAKMGAL